MNNKQLMVANQNKDDEFYSRMEDIQKEVDNYLPQLKNKVVYCNTDADGSMFVRYFREKEMSGEIKKLIYSSSDFRNENNIEKLKMCDVVITNPPFSIFREYLQTLVDHNKDFLIMGHLNSACYKIVMGLLMENKIRVGYNSIKKFDRPDGSIKTSSCLWYTTLDVAIKKPVALSAEYPNDRYKMYDNYNALNVDKCCYIPNNYYETMGVPINYIINHSYDQFELKGCGKFFYDKSLGNTKSKLMIDGKFLYNRIFIKRINYFASDQ